MHSLARALLLLVVVAPVVVLANWMERFEEDADGYGVEAAVENALEEDVAVRDILAYVIAYGELLNTVIVLKALYCAGADRDEVRERRMCMGLPWRRSPARSKRPLRSVGPSSL